MKTSSPDKFLMKYLHLFFFAFHGTLLLELVGDQFETDWQSSFWETNGNSDPTIYFGGLLSELGPSSDLISAILQADAGCRMLVEQTGTPASNRFNRRAG